MRRSGAGLHTATSATRLPSDLTGQSPGSGKRQGAGQSAESPRIFAFWGCCASAVDNSQEEEGRGQSAIAVWAQSRSVSTIKGASEV